MAGPKIDKLILDRITELLSKYNPNVNNLELCKAYLNRILVELSFRG